MKVSKIHRRVSIGMAVLIGVSTLLVSCSSQMAANIRKVTYPPHFKYVEPSELRSDMARLAQQMRLLDIALARDVGTSAFDLEQQRKDVLLALSNIEHIASSLRATDAGSSHPFLENHMGDFASQVGEARVAASLQQPRYYLAGKVSGGCVNCHRINR